MVTGGEYGKIFKRVWGDADFKALTAYSFDSDLDQLTGIQVV